MTRDLSVQTTRNLPRLRALIGGKVRGPEPEQTIPGGVDITTKRKTSLDDVRRLVASMREDWPDLVVEDDYGRIDPATMDAVPADMFVYMDAGAVQLCEAHGVVALTDPMMVHFTFYGRRVHRVVNLNNTGDVRTFTWPEEDEAR